MLVTFMTRGSRAHLHRHVRAGTMASVLKMFTYLAVALCLVYPDLSARRGLHRGEYSCFVLFATLGMMVMISRGIS